MNVSELIEVLQQKDPDLAVMISVGDEFLPFTVQEYKEAGLILEPTDERIGLST
jgi:hypothetical protein